MFNYKKYDIKRGLKIPRYSRKLAEFVGILTGDGYINHYPKEGDYVLDIAGHSKDDKEYHTNFISPLIKDLFGVKVNILFPKNQNCIHIRLRSKTIVSFLNNMGFPLGYKNQIGIPDWIKKKDVYITSFLRGLFDTDGSLSLKGKNKGVKYSPVLSISSKSMILIEDSYFWLKKWFNLCKCLEIQYDKRTNKDYIKHRLYINGYKNMELWKRMIGFSNSKHIKKYTICRKLNGASEI